VATCRGFYELLNHLLYRHVELSIPIDYTKDRFSRFFRAVQQKSNLTDHVRELKLFGPRPAYLWIKNTDENSSGIWIGEEWLTDFLYSQESRQERFEGEMVSFQSWDTRAVVALLLIRTKNLQSLDLGYAFWYSRLYLSRIFAKKEVLKNLKEVFLHSNPPAFGAD
jgi:hypothetical protein